jgi:hypothetical protein
MAELDPIISEYTRSALSGIDNLHKRIAGLEEELRQERVISHGATMGTRLLHQELDKLKKERDSLEKAWEEEISTYNEFWDVMENNPNRLNEQLYDNGEALDRLVREHEIQQKEIADMNERFRAESEFQRKREEDEASDKRRQEAEEELFPRGRPIAPAAARGEITPEEEELQRQEAERVIAETNRIIEEVERESRGRPIAPAAAPGLLSRSEFVPRKPTVLETVRRLRQSTPAARKLLSRPEFVPQGINPEEEAQREVALSETNRIIEEALREARPISHPIGLPGVPFQYEEYQPREEIRLGMQEMEPTFPLRNPLPEVRTAQAYALPTTQAYPVQDYSIPVSFEEPFLEERFPGERLGDIRSEEDLEAVVRGMPMAEARRRPPRIVPVPVPPPIPVGHEEIIMPSQDIAHMNRPPRTIVMRPRRSKKDEVTELLKEILGQTRERKATREIQETREDLVKKVNAIDKKLKRLKEMVMKVKKPKIISGFNKLNRNFIKDKRMILSKRHTAEEVSDLIDNLHLYEKDIKNFSDKMAELLFKQRRSKAAKL